MLKKLSRRFSLIACSTLLLVVLAMIGLINSLNFLRAVDGADETIGLIIDNAGMIPEKSESSEDDSSDGGSSDEALSSDDRSDSSDERSEPENNAGAAREKPEKSGADESAVRRSPNEPEKPGEKKSYGVIGDSSDKEKKERAESEMQYITRYFSAAFDGNGELLWISTSHIASLSEDEAIAYATSIYESGEETGFIDGMYYRYGIQKVTEDNENEILIVVYDFSTSSEQLKSTAVISLLIGIILFLICSLVITLLSKRAVRPIIDNMEKQGRFVTDAGHELKTPLAIIRADAEVIEMTGGESEWTKSILAQTDRLNNLLEQMLVLAKARENQKQTFLKVDLSGLAFSAENSFYTYCCAENKPLESDICDGVYVTGDAGMLEMLLSVLLQNAVKYGSDGQAIKFSLSQNLRYAKVKVTNFCDEPPKCDPKRLFDRFYREDTSRARKTGGSGIGLSIAQSITELHGGKIWCSVEGKSITFGFRIPLNNRSSEEN